MARKIVFVFAVLCVLSCRAIAFSGAPCGHATPFRHGETVVFLGDSITQQARYVRFVTDFYFLRYPDREIRYVNAGIGGDSIVECENRLEEDVLAHCPTTVSVMFGMNDVGEAGPFHDGYPSRADIDRRIKVLDRYSTAMGRLTESLRVRLPGVRLVAVTPSPYDSTVLIPLRPANFGWDSVLSHFSEYLLYEASTGRWEVCDIHTSMAAYVRTRQFCNPKFSLVEGDRTHPHVAGAFFMAWRYLVDQGVDPVVADVEINASDASVSKSVNAEVSGVHVGENGTLNFDSRERGLPLVVPSEVSDVAKDLPLRRDLNQWTLCVRGLESGRWEILVDQTQRVDIVTSAELSRGIGLGANENTPQHAQAFAVTAENARRHECESYLRRLATVRRYLLRQVKVGNPDDVAEVKAWADSHDCTVNWYLRQLADYIANWPKHEAMAEEVIRRERETRRLARTQKHRWTVRKVE